MTKMKTGELAEKVKLKSLANYAQRVSDGETLSSRDLKALAELQREFSEPGDQEPGYANRMEALRALKAQGFKIGKSKFYKHCSRPGQDNGICKVEKDGTVTEASLRRYIKHPGSQLLSDQKDDASGKAAIKQDREIRRIEIETELKEIELNVKKDLYIVRDEAVAQMCDIIEAIKSAAENMFSLKARTWLEVGKAEGADAMGAAAWEDFKDEFNSLSNMNELIIESAEALP